MSADTSSSVSKGVFVYKGKKSSINPADFIARSSLRDRDPDRVERMRLCDDLWHNVNDRIQSLQSDLSGKVFNDLLTYVRDVHGRSSVDVANRPRFSLTEIPTAALVTGVNSPDHTAMFSSLKSMLHDSVTHHVVSLRSASCHTIKSAVVNTVVQLLPLSASQVNDEDDDEMDVKESSGRVVKASCSMLDIVEWYTDLHASATASSGSAKMPMSPSVKSATPLKRYSSSSIKDSPKKCQRLTQSDNTEKQCPSSPLATRSHLPRSGQTPKKRQSCQQHCDSPAKRDSPLKQSLPSSAESPRHCPLSPRSGLRSSGRTPKKVMPSETEQCEQSSGKTPQKVVPLENEKRCLFSSGRTPQKIVPSENEQQSLHSNGRTPGKVVPFENEQCVHSSGKTPKKIAFLENDQSLLNTGRTPKRALPSETEQISSSPSRCPTSPRTLRSSAGSNLPRAGSASKKSCSLNKACSPELNSKECATVKIERIDSPSGKKKSEQMRPQASNTCAGEADRPPIVILLEDFECFDGRVLQDFITICGYHLDRLPLVLIFGVATTISAVHRLLPHSVTSLLSMEKFQAPLSSEYLSLVLSQILLNHDFPFKLGARVFDFLLDVFLFHDFSVLGFVRGYEFAMMEHFYSNPLSVLCQSSSIVNRVSKLTDKQLQTLRLSDSFKCYIDRRSAEERTKLMTDNKYTKNEIIKLLSALEQYHRCFYPVLACLHSITFKLPGCPLGKQLREVYAMCLSENLFESTNYQQALELLRSLSRDELVKVLSLCIDHLSVNTVPSELRNVLMKLCEFHENLLNIDDINMMDDDDDNISESPADILPKKTNIYALRQKLQELDKQRKDRKLTVYEKLRKETIDFLDSTFRQYLPCPKTFPLHEALYYDGVSELKCRMCAAPRASIQNALTRPFLYLENKALNISDDCISGDLPDICIVYKLHLECGRLINLYDWLQAFATVVQEKEDLDEDQKLTDVIQARFIRAVSELQFLGFIKATKRKTDHVARLTWGHC